jgi:hypothetical protein
MMELLISLHHRDSSRLAALRMTPTLWHVILSRSEEEAKNPYDETDIGIVPGILRRVAPQNDMMRIK